MENSEPPDKELVVKINSLLNQQRSTLPADAERLLKEVRDELKKARSDPSTGEKPPDINRVLWCLLGGFLKQEVTERIDGLEEHLDELVEQLPEVL